MQMQMQSPPHYPNQQQMSTHDVHVHDIISLPSPKTIISTVLNPEEFWVSPPPPEISSSLAHTCRRYHHKPPTSSSTSISTESLRHQQRPLSLPFSFDFSSPNPLRSKAQHPSSSPPPISISIRSHRHPQRHPLSLSSFYFLSPNPLQSNSQPPSSSPPPTSSKTISISIGSCPHPQRPLLPSLLVQILVS